MRLLRLELANFLSYRHASLELGDLTALVGPNASGKTNAVAALKLLHDIPEYGLQSALLRRGGFDQLRHRSQGRPFDPSIKLEFEISPDLASSRYELAFASVAGGRYAVKLEHASVNDRRGQYWFTHKRGRLETGSVGADPAFPNPPEDLKVPDGQSALGVMSSYLPFYAIYQLLINLQIVEINPALVRELQDPTPGNNFEPDGSNTASVFEQLDPKPRRALVDELAAIVPGLENIEVRRFSNRLTLGFTQQAGDARRSFIANQMSDGTLRAFAIVLALLQQHQPTLMVIEEPEAAIHLGALRTLVEVLQQHSEDVQILLTTHSADIIDALEIDQLRVIWTEDGVSHIAPVATHTKDTLRSGLITPGELLRADSLDPSPI